ncbi:ABC transporter ATP-binding protein [Anaeropeptidivorans aminofermentans]|uniref:ABC transporter ATP-binding protein n=1 Tax=Anaeropeptidivorans aminofermentans TaxID=2934315 RepID=UPI002025870F|nr:ABC transporter ATP-binding protein [Anaeropeptidivorans aminofermentans]
MKKRKKNVVIRLMQFFSGLEIKMIVVLVSSILSMGLFVSTPVFLGQATDIIANGVMNSVKTGVPFQVNMESMGRIILILLTLYLFSFITNYLGNYIMSSVCETVGFNMRTALSHKLHRLPLKFFDGTERGEVLSRATNDIEKVVESLREGLNRLIGAFISILIAVIMMLKISPVLFLAAFFTIGLAVGITYVIARSSRKSFLEYQTSLGSLNGNIEESFTGQLIIKAFNYEEKSFEEFQEINNRLFKASHRSQVAQFIIIPVIRIVNNLGYVLIALMSAFYVFQGRMTIGTVQTFIQYVDKAAEPIVDLSQILNTMQQAVAASQRFFEIMDEEDEEPDRAKEGLMLPQKGEVSFEHVKFGYNGELLMHDINLSLKPGERVAIVGPTGAGKTTIVNLLMRFYEINGGKISIDGINTRDLTRKDLRSLFGMVLQDTWLFGGSIKDNIAYGNENADENAIINAAKSAGADFFIRTLPDGYHTVLNEDSSNISQGQKQLLTIARAFLKDPAILILDEATSSVDTRTEKEIQKAMDKLMKGRTSFIIAHKLSTIRDADLIIVMEQGNIVEQGTHEELIAKKGSYEKLYYSQFA